MVGDWPKLRPAEAARSVVFFGLLYVYLWRVVEPRLIYDCATITNFPVFYKGWSFFGDCLSYPGGLLRYLCALLPQFFYYSWAGALIITGQAWSLVACTGWLFRSLGVPTWRLLRFIPALLVLAVYAQYAYHFPTVTGALAALVFGCLYVALVSRDASGRAGLGEAVRGCTIRDVAHYLLLSGASYVISAAAFLPFAALCVLYEWLYRRRYLVGLIYLLAAAGLPYVAGVLLFQISVVNAYTDMLPLSWQIRDWFARRKMIEAVYGLYLLPLGVALVWGLVAWAATVIKKGRPRAPARPPARKRVGWVRRPAVPWAAGSLLLFAVGGPVAFVALDRDQRALLRVHDYACHRRWPEVLQASRNCMNRYAVMNAVNRALYHTGRLNQDIFRYLQYPDALVFTGEDHNLFYWHKLDTLIDLGLVNQAEKNLVECMEMFGAHPMILQRLAFLNLAKGRIEAARVYLERLRKTLFFNHWARDYLARLAADPTLAADAEIQQLRARMLRRDTPALFYAPEPMLQALAGQGGQNRMAFEYLMGWYMINKQLGKFVQNLGRLPEFGYTEIPPLYQEAALIYSTKYPVPLGDFAIDPALQQRIKRFSDVFNQYGRDKKAAFDELARDYAGSYFFYFIYAESPARQ
jgi:hypothetical protein